MTSERTPPRFFGMALLTLALTGCAQVIGIDDFTVDEGAGNASGPGSGSGSNSGSGGSGSGTGSGTGGGEPMNICEAVHGCTLGMADNQTASPNVYIGFTLSGYDPNCALVKAGSTVIFISQSYNFDEVPIQGGVIGKPDMGSPIKNPSDTTMNEVSIPLPLPGECAYPYYSPKTGKTGVIFIEPLAN